MKYDPRDYEIRITYSAAPGDECFIARVVEWPQVNAHGETREEAAREIQVALELTLDVFEKDGTPIPAPKLARANARAHTRLHAQAA